MYSKKDEQQEKNSNEALIWRGVRKLPFMSNYGRSSQMKKKDNMSGKKDDVQTSVPKQQEQTMNDRESGNNKANGQQEHRAWRMLSKIPFVKYFMMKTSTLEQRNSSTQLRSSSPSTPSIKLSDDDKNLINSIYTETANGQAKDDEGWQMKIQKVPEFILSKKIFKDNYLRKPKVIAIGCFYADCEELKKTDLKKRLVRRFIQESRQSAETLLGEIKKSFTLDELRKLYEQHVITEHGEDELARMLFIDGCSVLQFINGYVDNDMKEFDEISNGEVDEIGHDLFLLENQIPFKALVILMRLSDKGFDLATNLYHFVSMNTMAPLTYSLPRLLMKVIYLMHQEKGDKQVFEGNNMPVHLLDLLRSELLYDDNDDDELLFADDDDSKNKNTTTVAVKEGGDRYNLLDGFNKRSFRNIQDLKEVGIKLKPDYSRGLRSVSFSSRLHIFGRLNLPPLIVDESTKQKLLNLVAYEMCPGNNEKNYAVTSYVRLLDSLIDNEQDVKDLRAAHILRNNLSSDKQVAQLFNTIGSSLVPQDSYLSVEKDIQKYYERKVANWKSQFYRQHCRNPWSLLALFAALAAFILAGIQAYYSANPKK